MNAISDIDWEHIYNGGKNIFEIFPTVTFYDYTKNSKKFQNKPNNYNLTYSYTGKNWLLCEELLNKGFNVAMVFNVKNESELPTMYKGFKVINGDETDYRPNDGNGIIVGLKWKKLLIK